MTTEEKMTDNKSLPCPACHEEIEADAKFCKHCGNKLDAADCAECGTALDPGARFCKGCGASTGVEAAQTKPKATKAADTSASAKSPAPSDKKESAPSADKRPAPRPVDPAGRRVPKTAHKSSNQYLLYGGIVGVLLAAIAIYFGIKESNEREKEVGGGPLASEHVHDNEGGGGMGVVPTGEPIIGGTVEIGGAVKDAVPGGGVYYIMARPVGGEAGPPIAVVKIPAAATATPFSIGPQDMMTGGGINGPVGLQVRWDQDGDAMTKQPGDLVGSLAGPIAPGTMDAKLLVDEVLDGESAAPAAAADSQPAEGAESQPAEAAASQPAEAADSQPAEEPSSQADTEEPANTEGQPITGTIQFAPDLLPSSPERGTIYLIARDPEVQRGPPAAVVRLNGAAGPIPFSIGQDDMMIKGTPFGKVNLEVRWDQDGNAMTKAAGDVEGTFANNPVAPGTKGVIIVLDRVRN